MKPKLTLTVAATAAALACAVATAQPSSYFLWKNKTTGQTMCETDADANWVKVSGPYEDPNCRFLIKQ